jgi:hypothetical protein
MQLPADAGKSRGQRLLERGAPPSEFQGKSAYERLLCCAREALLKIALSSAFYQPCIGYPA